MEKLQGNAPKIQLLRSEEVVIDNSPKVESGEKTTRISSQKTKETDGKQLCVHKLNPREIIFNFSTSHNLDKELQKLATYKDGDYIQEVTLHFSSCDLIGDELMQKIGRMLSNFPNLRCLSLDDRTDSLIKDMSRSCFDSRITAKGLQHLANAIKDLKSLHKLNLCLSLGDKPDEKLIHTLEQIIKKMSGLKELCIDISYDSAITYDLLIKLANIIECKTRLTNLRLSLWGVIRNYSENSTEEGINRLIKSCAKLVNLKKLDLEFVRSKLSRENLSNLATTLEQLNKLQSLHLKLCDREGHLNGDWTHIANSIASLPLEEFSFEFGPNTTSYGIGLIAGAARNLSKLSTLRLAFAPLLMIQRYDWQDIINIFESLDKLAKLELNLSDRAYIPYDVSEELFYVLNRLKKLNSLKLDFSNSKFMNNRVLVMLTDTAINLPQLMKLKINLSNCNCIDESGIHYFVERLGKLKSVTKLEFQLNGGLGGDYSLSTLGLSLSKLKQVKQLDIDLSKCWRLTENGVGEFLDYLNNLPELSTFNIKLLSIYTINWREIIGNLKNPTKLKIEQDVD